MVIDDRDLWVYRALPVRAIDGDTIEVVIDLGLHVHTTQRLRLTGIDAPELFRGDDREAGAAARDFVTAWLNNCDDGTLDWPLIIRTHKDRQSFNRYIAAVFSAADGTDLGLALVEAGHARESSR